MTDNRLLRLQKMAQRFNEIGAVSDDTVRNIATRVQAQEQHAQREQHDQMDGARIKMLRRRLGLSQADLAAVVNMSTTSVQKWERNAVKPQGAALRMLEIIEQKGVASLIISPRN
ncbi:helix-turn-helix domain-containing protein [Serratia marcescens]|mgnify:FL=1|jgi:putative transcriptional regulator|uniref:Transcriptional regulator n=3 Tax=Serratia TaxID=613 RepID=A0ABC9IM07_SERMA|nr:MULTISPECIES: helix-turn-helix domain-containing protein [Serratia]QHI79728.1 helix-turn-helix domain-containing protein [Serratia sp. NGAS9]ASL84405.1 transcriptional regulator [Serratia marcescens]ASM22994.1 transcriptional regulator [Serratia marcescens]ASM27767.1 transcriptional regulator [Serratia marcescens]ASM32666.1 transcriptional regulator [Serratia marcescens]